MTDAQRDLFACLHAVMARHRWSTQGALLEVLAGPRTFDVRCSRAPATLWHWIGTAEQILETVDQWFTDRRTTHAHEFHELPDHPAPFSDEIRSAGASAVRAVSTSRHGVAPIPESGEDRR